MIFQYASIQSIRDYGTASTLISDALARQLIIKNSLLINKWAEQKFVPINSIERISGGASCITFSGKNLIKVNSVNYVNSDFTRTLIETSNYEVIGNSIRFNFTTLEGIKNLEIDAIFGTIDNIKDITVELTSQIVKDSISFTVVDASLLEAKDVLLYGNYSIIVNSINYNTKTISIDKFPHLSTLISGTELKCYGMIPTLIERAIYLLVKNYRTLENRHPGKIKREETDDYEYELFQQSSNSSGIAEVDSILNSFISGNLDVGFW